MNKRERIAYRCDQLKDALLNLEATANPTESHRAFKKANKALTWLVKVMFNWAMFLYGGWPE